MPGPNGSEQAQTLATELKVGHYAIFNTFAIEVDGRIGANLNGNILASRARSFNCGMSSVDTVVHEDSFEIH